MSSNNQAETLKTEGNELFKQKKYGDALKRYLRATEIDPGCAMYWSNLASCYGKLYLCQEMKDAAQKCLDIDPSSIKGHYHLATSFMRMMDYEQADTAISRGLSLHPNNAYMQTLESRIKEEIERQKLLSRDTLRAKGKKLRFYGGMPSSGELRIPEGTTYSQLERTCLPKISKKMMKCREAIKPVIRALSSEAIVIKWLASDILVVLDCFLDDSPSPIIHLDIDHEEIASSISQNSKWHKFLTLDETNWLIVLLSQRFLREKGSQIEQSILITWANYTVRLCYERALWKHAVDLNLILTDIIFNQNLTETDYDLKLDCLSNLGFAFHTAGEHDIGAKLHLDVLKVQEYDNQISSKFSKQFTYYAAAVIYCNSGDYIKAENFIVKSLRESGKDGWDWDQLKTISRSDHNIVTLAVIYRTVIEAVICQIKTDEKHVGMFKVSTVLLALFSCAGIETVMFHGLIYDHELVFILKKTYKDQRAARDVIAWAISMPTIEKYHKCILKCVACHVDMNKIIHDITKNNSSGDISDMQTEFWAYEEARLNQVKSYHCSSEHPIYDIRTYCGVCRKSVSSMQIKTCSCKKAHYCSEGKSYD